MNSTNISRFQVHTKIVLQSFQTMQFEDNTKRNIIVT